MNILTYGILSQITVPSRPSPPVGFDVIDCTALYLFDDNTPMNYMSSDYDLQIIKAGSDLPTADDPSLRISGNTAFNLGGAGDFAGTGLTNQSVISHNGFTYATAATLMGWAKTTDRTINYQSPFGMCRNSGQLWRVYVPNDTFRPTAQRFNGTTNNTVASGSAISNNIWYHYTMTYNASDTKMYFYIDGSLIGSVTLGAGNRNDSVGGWTQWVDGLNIGFPQKFKESSNDAVHDRWKGQIDDVRFYAGRTMSGVEVTAVFNNTKASYGK